MNRFGGLGPPVRPVAGLNVGPAPFPMPPAPAPVAPREEEPPEAPPVPAPAAAAAAAAAAVGRPLAAMELDAAHREVAEMEAPRAFGPVRRRNTGKRIAETSTALPAEGVMNNPGESVQRYIERLTRIAGPQTDNAEDAFQDISRARAWVGFARYLRRQEGVRTWEEFVDLWNEYQHESRRMEPPGRRPPPGEGAASASGAGKFVETPESLRLQPQAKA